MPLDNPRSDFSNWYSEVIRRADIVDIRTPIKGANVLLPNGYEIWEGVKEFLDKRFKETGHKNAYFPLFIPEEFLERESEHFSGFVPEVAWVTHVGDKELNEKYALRPTSETIMYYMYSQWIHSHADLPMKFNQWCNIIRWDTKETRPLLRDREFFWSEAHTCHPTFEKAAEQVEESMEIYQTLFDWLCLSYMTFKRPEHDTFPGAEYTIAYDAPLPNGKVLQIGTTHHLGNSFAKAFDVTFLDVDEETKYVYQTSYGISTRLIASILSLHGDDQGLILPPRLAPTQIVIVPITFEDSAEEVLNETQKLEEEVSDLEYKVHADTRDQYTPGWKFSEWEMKGVPIRLELGPRDLENNQVMVVRRDTGEKEAVPRDELKKRIEQLMEDIASTLKQRADQVLTDMMRSASNLDELKAIMDGEQGFIESYWCGSIDCVDKIEDETTAGILGEKYGEEEIKKGPCLICEETGSQVYLGSSY